ncbi:dicarboxylate/amino acid:cation symporter [Marinilabiliaceae bacterium ANBcel2]|nr:dicarboxylate/amino acid:cation symporter [Marinilabiliaceae bacterium ANBcel2]
MRIPLYVQIIIGIVAGVIWAVVSGFVGLSSLTEKWIAPFGNVFLNLLQLIAVPLVFFSIIGGIISLGNSRNLGKLGGKTMMLYFFTTLLSVTLGLFIVNFFKPGNTFDDASRLDNRINYELWLQSQGAAPHDNNWYLDDSANRESVERLRELSQFAETEDMQDRVDIADDAAQQGPLKFIEDIVPSNIFFSFQDNSNMLQIIFFAIFFGIAILFIPDEKKGILIKFFDAVTAAFIKMVEIVMIAAPFFVFALMAGMVNEMAGDNPARILDLFTGLTWYALAVLAGLLLMAFVIYPSILALFVKNLTYREFLRGISPAQMLAFSTSSSAATLPVTIECVEENLKVDKKITSFVLPIGATINMDGTSLYQAIAVVFLAQMHMVDLAVGQQLTIVMTAVLASIGSAAIPGAGIIMLMVVLSSVGLNPGWVAIILPVDRILDMVRTSVNVTGDGTVTVLIARTTKFLKGD